MPDLLGAMNLRPSLSSAPPAGRRACLHLWVSPSNDVGTGDMPTGSRPGQSWAASLRRMHALVRSLNDDLDLDRTLLAVCRGLTEVLGFGVAVVNQVTPDGDLLVVACEGDASARQALLGQRATRQSWDTWMAACEPIGDLLVDYRDVDAAAAGGSVPTWTPDLAAAAVPGAWSARDALLAPMRTFRSGLLGVISVDLPADGLRPGPQALELLEMYAAQAAVAVANAQLHTRLREQDHARALALTRLAAVVDSVPVAIVELDLDGNVRLWNDAAEAVFGWPAREVLGRRNPLADRGPGAVTLGELLADGGLHRTQSSRPHRNGNRVEVEMTTSALIDEHGQPYGYLGVYVDVSSRMQLERELRAAAATDPLTGLANRAEFTRRLTAADRPAVVLLDLDGFKAVNDTHGHAAGDLVLVEVAGRLRAACRADDLVARLGGDEFVVLLAPTPILPDAAAGHEGAASQLLAEQFAQRLVDTLAEPFDIAGQHVTLGASAGLALGVQREPAADGAGEHGGLDLGQVLLRDADTAMYAAKANGKNRLQTYYPALRDRLDRPAATDRTATTGPPRSAPARASDRPQPQTGPDRE